jgi:hypothetical protein
MGRTQKKPEPEEEAKVLPASEALSLISGGRQDEEEDDSGRGEEAVGDPDRRAEGARDPASPET